MCRSLLLYAVWPQKVREELLAVWTCQREAISTSFCEKVNFLESIRKEKKLHAEVAQIYGKSKSFVCEEGKRNSQQLLCCTSNCKSYSHST
jgi:hypothetical protein